MDVDKKEGDEAEKKEDGDAKEEEEDEAEVEEEKGPEKPKELEEDAPADGRPKVGSTDVCFESSDSTLNVLSAPGNVFTTLGEGGLHFLLAGMRANSGVTAGRYMFEMRTIEAIRYQGTVSRDAVKLPQNLFRIGFSLQGSSLFLGDKQDSVYFDSDGMFGCGQRKQKVERSHNKFGTFAVLLNLDEKSANANTISLFKDGKRISQPKPLPENLKGKALFPTVTFKNMTLELNLGPVALAPLEFSCRMVGDAAKGDLTVLPSVKPPDGKYEVVFPVGLPDKGFFEWVDAFIEKNPGYTELSDRKLIDWAVKSGLWRAKNTGSNDKPTKGFGIEMMDDSSVQRTLSKFVATQNRHYVVAELKANLQKAEREKGIKKFISRQHFKTTAAVIMGTPNADFKARVHAKLLAAKQAKADQEKRKAAAAAKRKKAIEESKKKQEAKKAKKAEGDGEDKEAKEEEANKEEEAGEAEEPEEAAPPVELTEEEKAVCFTSCPIPDLSEQILAKAYASFTLPEAAEGFDSIQYHWDNESTSAETVKSYVMQKKLSQKVEDLKPGTWFKEKQTEWTKKVNEWKKLCADWKDPTRKKALLKKKLEALKKTEAGEAEKKDGEESKEEVKEGDEEPKEEPKAKEEKEDKDEIKLPEIKLDDLDVFEVADVTDVGSGEPLFSKFTFEDWALLSIRYELHLLTLAFKKDLDDTDRPTFPQSHFSFYYNKYFKKRFSISDYGFKELSQLIEIIKETVEIKGERECLEAQLSDTTEISEFVKFTEDHRRDRIRRVDAGDESALLKFVRPRQESNKGKGDGGSKGGSKGGAAQKRPWTNSARDAPPARRDSAAPRRPPPAPAPPVRRDGNKRPWEGGGGGGGGSHRGSDSRSGGGSGSWRGRDEPAWKRQNTGRAGGGYSDAPRGGRDDGKSKGKGGKGGSYYRR